MLDPISDMLSRIRNAQMAGHKEVEIPASKLKMAIAKILKEEGFVAKAKKISKEKFDFINIELKYDKVSRTEEAPMISEIKRVSKEGQRIYKGKSEIRKVKNGLGFSIISTSKGVMTNKKAKKAGVGGEIICEVW